jgi:hypothetical protein
VLAAMLALGACAGPPGPTEAERAAVDRALTLFLDLCVDHVGFPDEIAAAADRAGFREDTRPRPADQRVWRRAGDPDFLLVSGEGGGLCTLGVTPIAHAPLSEALVGMLRRLPARGNRLEQVSARAMRDEESGTDLHRFHFQVFPSPPRPDGAYMAYVLDVIRPERPVSEVRMRVMRVGRGG